MNRLFRTSVLVIALGLAISACKRDNANPANPNNPGAGDEEVITTVELHFTNASDTTDHRHYRWYDADGSGSGNAVVDSIVLKPSTTYNVEVKVLDQTKTPVKNIAEEIEEEANYHRFHYTFTPAQGSTATTVNTTITDLDTQTPPQPLGLRFSSATGAAAGKGTFNINLRHFANNSIKTNVATDGESDLDVDFRLVVKP